MSEIDNYKPVINKEDNVQDKKIIEVTPIEETKEEPVKETQPVKEPESNNVLFSKKERDEAIKQFIKTHEEKTGKLRRKEKKMIENAEYDSTSGRIREVTIGIAIFGIILIVMLRSFLPDTALFALLVIIGATSFFPCGMIIGWLLFDPVMRCKVLRKTSRRNYGVINFVGHGNKIFTKIKNFDQALIWKENECWVIAKSRVYQISKDGNAVNTGKEIDPKSVLTYVDTVPVIFIDMESMEPIKILKDERTQVHPQEIGSALKAWVDNQRAKMMAVKKMTDTMLMVAVIACVGAVVVSFITMGRVEEMHEEISIMKEQLKTLLQLVQSK